MLWLGRWDPQLIKRLAVTNISSSSIACAVIGVSGAVSRAGGLLSAINGRAGELGVMPPGNTHAGTPGAESDASGFPQSRRVPHSVRPFDEPE